jgi:hypothetical protein
VGLLQAVLHRMFPPAAESIAEVSSGRRVVIRGRVVARDLIESPLTEKRCVYYRYLVEQWKRDSLALLGTTGMWQLVDTDEAIAEFYVEDGSGRALVIPEHASVDLPPGQRVDLGDGQRAQEARFGEGDEVEIEAIAHDGEDLLDEGRGYRERTARLILRVSEGDVLRIRVLRR